MNFIHIVDCNYRIIIDCEKSLTGYKLVIFDMDGTLITQESSWGAINKFFGTSRESKKSMILYLKGKINYSEWMRRDITSWPRPIHISSIKEILSNWVFKDGALEVIQEIKKKNIEIGVISSGIDVLVEEVSQRLGISIVKVNRLVVDEKGFLTGKGIMEVDPLRKDIVLEDILEHTGIELNECMAIADSVMDASLLKAAGRGFFLGNESDAYKIGVKKLQSLWEILEHL